MWTEKEMAEVVDAFEIEKENRIFLHSLIKVYLEKERARKNFHQICIKEIVKDLCVIGLDIVIFLMEPSKIVSIFTISFFTGTYIVSKEDTKRYLEIEAHTYHKNNKLFINMFREFLECGQLEITKYYANKYVLDSKIRETEEETRKSDLKELYKLKAQMLSSYTKETTKQKEKK